MGAQTVVEWRVTEEGLRPFVVDEQGTVLEEPTWAPQPGSQQAFLECPVFEILLEGNRGGGKTDVLIMDFAQHVGQGYGREWRGILFRQTYKQLEDVIAKTKKWFSQIFPAATWNETKLTWAWPTGETLRLSYMEKEDDYWNYHGHSYPWIGWEELTTWANDRCYKKMMSCSRSTRTNMPRKYRSTTNPYGVGHSWVKARFRLPISRPMVGPVIEEADDDGNVMQRVAIRSKMSENRVMLHADPSYETKVVAAAASEAERRAWQHGDWDIVAGGMFDDLWTPHVHVIPDIDFQHIPAGWKINRAYDDGLSHPFSVGWWAESNGEPYTTAQGRIIGGVRGDLIRIAEWYGWNGRPNEGLRLLAREIADGILEREDDWGLRGLVRVGPADNSIFSDFQPGSSIAGEMKKRGVTWVPIDKGKGSRKQGWSALRTLLKGALPGVEGRREEPGIFVCERCIQFIRTFPVLPRDKDDMDDVDTKAEDHIADETRYRVRQKTHAAGSWSW